MSRRKPYHQKVLEGTIKPGRHPLSPPGAPPMRAMDLKEPPEWIGEYGREFWQRVAPKLIKLGLLTEIDEGSFSMLCASYDQARESQELLRKQGLTVEDERKLPRKHPLYQVFRESTRQFFTMAKEFGLQPAARGTMDLRILDPEDDDLQKFLGRSPSGIGKLID